MKKIKPSKFKLGNNEEYKNKFFNEDAFFSKKRNNIFKVFLSHFLDVDVYTSTFEDIRNEYIYQYDNNVPEDEKEFYYEIDQKFGYLGNKPKEKLLKNFREASKDLAEIQTHLNYLENETNQLKTKKEKCYLNGKDRYYLKLLLYYQNKNLTAQKEITQYLSTGIKKHTLEHFSPLYLALKASQYFYQKMPYKYSPIIGFENQENEYDVKNLTDISNKFDQLYIEQHIAVKELYDKDRDEFYKTAESYIIGGEGLLTSPTEHILNALSTNHILNKRKETIETLIKHYQNKDYISFINMLPLQVEGIFHDVCLELGIKESKLEISSLNSKLLDLNAKLNRFRHFEYYSFKFPVIRNLVAHGGLIDGNIKRTAIMLMLDLQPVCTLATSEEIPINKSIKLINELAEKYDDSKQLEWIDYIYLIIPEYYNLANDIEKISNYFLENKFWKYIKIKISKAEDLEKPKINNQIKRLLSSDIAKRNVDIKRKCQEFFKST